MAKDLDAAGIARAALPVAILAALRPQAAHGYALIELLSTHGFPDLKGGTLYPILARLERQGLVRSAWDHSQSGPGRKMFTTTAQGDLLLDAATQAWQDMGRTLEYLSTRGRDDSTGTIMHFRQAAAATALVSTLILISGCSSAGYGIAALNRDATAEDRLPDVVVDESVNVDSVRKVAEQNQVAYFIGAMNDDQGYCAYAVDNDDENFIGGCGSGSGQLITVAPGGSPNLRQMTLVMDSYDSEDLKRDNWSEVHTNILIR